LVGESHALISNDVIRRDPDVVEVDDGRVRAPHAHLVDLFVESDSGRFHWKANQGFVQVARLVAACVR